jgi:hypothetical protein
LLFGVVGETRKAARPVWRSRLSCDWSGVCVMGVGLVGEGVVLGVLVVLVVV